MNKPKPRVLLISSQPIQNSKPLQLLSQSSEIDMLVVFCSLPDQEMEGDIENINKHVFDIPILSGYKWVHPKNYSPFPSLYHAFGLINFGIIKLIKEYDCCIELGHAYFSFWLAIVFSKIFKKPLILSNDAISLVPLSGGNWKVPFKKILFPILYNRVSNAVMVPSNASKEFLQSIGISGDKIFVAPYNVDNNLIAETAKSTDRIKIRNNWGIPTDGIVLVFCAKFIPRKRPQDLIRAFAKASVDNSYLVMVGDGPLKQELETEVNMLGIQDNVRFPGFVKYSKLPEVYASSDILVHTAEWEPYGLPVNEAMVCGLPVVVSDRVGAGLDLVEDGITGYRYLVGDIDTLANILKKMLTDSLLIKRLGKSASELIAQRSPEYNAELTENAIEYVLSNK